MEQLGFTAAAAQSTVKTLDASESEAGTRRLTGTGDELVGSHDAGGRSLVPVADDEMWRTHGCDELLTLAERLDPPVTNGDLGIDDFPARNPQHRSATAPSCSAEEPHAACRSRLLPQEDGWGRDRLAIAL